MGATVDERGLAVTTDEHGLVATGDGTPPRSGARRTGSDAGAPAAYAAGCTVQDAPAPGPGPGSGRRPRPGVGPGLGPGAGPGSIPGPGAERERPSSPARAVREAQRRAGALAARAGARLGVSAARALSALEKVQGWSAGVRARHARDAAHEATSVPTLEEAAEAARKEWLRAISYFDQVVDPDLIDYATYSLRAAERKYVYLLKKAREENAAAVHTATR